MNESLKRTKPAFLQNGTVTAGNSCGVNDGACAVLVMEEGQARKLGYKPVLRFVRSAVVGVDPKLPGTGPIFAVNKLLNEMNVKVEDIDYFEINEAFASKVVACAKELQIPYEKSKCKWWSNCARSSVRCIWCYACNTFVLSGTKRVYEIWNCYIRNWRRDRDCAII